MSPNGTRALKLYDSKFSEGAQGAVEDQRIRQQIELGEHDCPSLVKVYAGGKFEGRLYLVMSRAAGQELEKRLADVPRESIRLIVDQIARAVIFLNSKDMCHRDIKAANIFVSDDFTQATLLDISVIRNIHDPVGIGTDRDGQLPIVATARYSPPEYLFRLLDPGPQLWHALSVYQMGALLHDLITRKPLFQAEFLKSSSNRYRFAWIVATTEPQVEANDVDQDLVFTARRALDKDWERRSQLTLSQFLSGTESVENQSLEFLGLSAPKLKPANVPEHSIAARLEHLRTTLDRLEQEVLELLKSKGITATHKRQAGPSDDARLLVFGWNPTQVGAAAEVRALELTLTLRSVLRSDTAVFTVSISLSANVNGTPKSASMDIPDVMDAPSAISTIVSAVNSSLGPLASEIASVKNKG